MQWVDRIRQVKIVLVVMAVMISVASLVVSHVLVKDLSNEERNKMEVWAEAMRTLNNADGETDLTLVLKVINGNNTIPVIVLDRSEEVLTYRNLVIKAACAADSSAVVLKQAQAMKKAGNVIRLSLAPTDISSEADDYIDICFDESTMLKRLASYPYVQLGVVLIFVVVAIFALLSSKKAEQNKVWVGLSKETAHQLGTPISSLMAWVEILHESYPDDELIPEMDEDVKRLQRIAERFSKIGSLPEAKTENLNDVISHVAEYITRRTSNKVVLQCRLPEPPLMVNLCAPLFEWVVENLCKNAVDAMDGCGNLVLSAFEESGRYVVEISDTGKGIARNRFKSVFTPGFTTKERGWGLGLSLAKRIVEEYHKGRIFVKSSELGKGTTFRIELKKY
jgi:sensor histidine kinase